MSCEPAEEIPYNGIDEDCDGTDLVDVDGDDWDATRVGGEDCDDADAAANPDAAERCANLVDDDCDGVTDEGCSASRSPPDPGGISWICGVHPATAGGALLIPALLSVALRRWGRG